MSLASPDPEMVVVFRPCSVKTGKIARLLLGDHKMVADETGDQAVFTTVSIHAA